MGLAQSKGEPVAMWVLERRRLGGSLMMVVSGSRRCRGVRDRGREKKERKRGSLAVRVAGVVEVVDAKVMVDDGEEELARWVLGSRRWLAMVVLWFSGSPQSPPPFLLFFLCTLYLFYFIIF
ncbi:hypothetical protein AHAS_Ahas11G0217700 [Arachis hypogaea]